MKRLIVGIVTAAVLVSMARTAMAQSKTVSSEMRTETATVESIDPSTRTVTLKKPDGTFVQTVAGPDIKRLEEIKAGDTVNVRYRERNRPGEAARRVGRGEQRQGHDWFRTGPAWWHESQAGDDHGHDYGHRPDHAVDHVHWAKRLEVHRKCRTRRLSPK